MPTAHSVGVGGDVEEAPVRRTRRGVRGIRIDGLVAPGAEVRSKPPDCGRDTHYWAPTGSPEAVARLRFPQNVACGFPAPRSSVVVSQLSLLFAQVSFPWSADLLIE